MRKTIATTCMLLALVAGAARADTLLIDGVESTYGAPAQKHATVGQPPITRWDYPNFSVYFEHDRVIHAVVKR